MKIIHPNDIENHKNHVPAYFSCLILKVEYILDK